MGRRAKGEGSITQHKNGQWQAEFLLGYDGNGKRKRKYITGKTQKEVREKLDALKRQVSDGTFSDAKLTVKDYLAGWLKEKSRQVKPRTAELYGYLIEAHIVPSVGRIQLSKLTPVQVQGMLGNICEKAASEVGKRNKNASDAAPETQGGAGVRTANQCRTVLFSALKQAVRWQLIARNPVEAVDPLKTHKKELTLWTMPEAARFLDTARPHRLYALFYLALSTGMRRGELLGMRWADIEGATIHVRQSLNIIDNKIAFGVPKTDKGKRRVAISPDVLETLARHRQLQAAEQRALGSFWPDTGLVFTTEIGTPMHPRNLERTWYALQKKTRAAWSKELEGNEEDTAKLKSGKSFPHVRFHDLRHLHASIAIRQGMDVKMLADRLGHSRTSLTLDVYTHLFEEQRATSAVDISGLLVTQTQSIPN